MPNRINITRFSSRRYTLWQNVTLRAFVATVMNFLQFVGMVCAPVPIFRLPGYVDPHVYAAFVCTSLFATNWALVAFAVLLQGGDCGDHGLCNDGESFFFALAVATGAAVLGAGLFLLNIERRFLGTFYKRHSYQQLLKELNCDVVSITSRDPCVSRAKL